MPDQVCEDTESQQQSLDPQWDYSNTQMPESKVRTNVQQIENGARESWAGLLLLIKLSAESVSRKSEIWKQDLSECLIVSLWSMSCANQTLARPAP